MDLFILAAEKTNMHKRKSVLVGTGGIADSHVKGARSQGERLDLVAAMDVDRAKGQAFCDRFELDRCYGDFAEMLDREKPDLVQIAVPPQFHCELAVKSMEAGAWVYCEKPLCASLAELDRIEAAEKATGRYCASVFQMRYGPSNRHFKDVVRSGDLGRMLVAFCHTLWYRDDAYYAVPWRGSWKSELGGATMTQGIHAIDQFLDLMGDWEEVAAMAGSLDRRMEVEDVSMALVRFSSGALGSIINSVLSPRQVSHMRFDLQKATVELNHLYFFNKDDWTITPAEGAEETDGVKRLAEWPEDAEVSHGIQLGAILNDMDADRRPLTSGPGARETLSFIASLYKSVFTGELVRKGSVGPGDPFYDGMNGGQIRLPDTFVVD